MSSIQSRGRRSSRAEDNQPLSPGQRSIRSRSASSDALPVHFGGPVSSRAPPPPKRSESQLSDRDRLPSEVARREREASPRAASRWEGGRSGSLTRNASQRSSYAHSEDSSGAEEEEALHEKLLRHASIDRELHNRDVSPSFFPQTPSHRPRHSLLAAVPPPHDPKEEEEREPDRDSAWGRFDFGLQPDSPFHPTKHPSHPQYRGGAPSEASDLEVEGQPTSARPSSEAWRPDHRDSRRGRRLSVSSSGSGSTGDGKFSKGEKKGSRSSKGKGKKARSTSPDHLAEQGRLSPHLLGHDVSSKPPRRWYKNPIVLLPLSCVVLAVIGVCVWAAVSASQEAA
ncbi:hypothetical protein JCM11251_005272 [Rhodosporidiobolus azoricus]